LDAVGISPPTNITVLLFYFIDQVYPVVFQAEAFNPKQCPTDDMWPCDAAPSKAINVVDFEKLCSFKV
jgi:hypothetical protein